MFVRFAQLLFFIAVIHRLTQSDSVILSQSDIYNDKKLLYYSLKAFENGTEEDIILFKGQRTPEAFDLNNKNAHAVFNVSIAFTSWKQMTAMINATAFAAPGNKAVHVHNQNMPFSHFLMNVIRDTGLPRPFPSEPMDIPLQTWLQTMDQGQPPIVITNQVDENYGWLSTFIRNRTVNWGNLTKDLNDQCSDYNSVRRFLNSSKILLIVTSSHVDPQIGFHEKIISLPLGVNVKEVAFSKAKLILTLPYRKKKLLLINNSGWGGRRHINAVVSKAFNNTIHNTYKKHNNRVVRMGRNLTVPLDHYLEIATSKFVLCPSGLGYDTFRLWETILLGSIPIVESSSGLDRAYANLPVLVVRDFRDVTPQLLERAYPCFLSHADQFRFNNLREDYWLNLIFTAIKSGSISHVTENHPFRSRFCNFLADN